VQGRDEKRVAIVTGGNGGLGRAIREAMLADGLHVLAVDVTGDDAFTADVGTADGNRAMVDEALRRWGRLDVLVLNATQQHVAALPDFEPAEWDRVIDVGLKGPYLALRFAWPHLTLRPGGRVVFTASVNAYLGEPFKVAYNAAKAGLLGVMRTAAIEGATSGLTANAVAPGLMMTPLIERQLDAQVQERGVSREEVVAEWIARHPAGRAVKVEEVASVVAFLASPAASGVNGTCIPVDLGLSASI
jgi:3-hydroxybutyrate dehydrogenase